MKLKLQEYNEKRDFDRSLEPEGRVEESDQVLRFVVQHHLARRDHYDLRLEWKGVLLSWAVPRGPSYSTKDKRLAVHVEDHPLEYRHFEGTIPKGEYGGGVVMIWDEGFWEPYKNVEEGIESGEIKFILKGSRLKGKWALIRLKGKDGDTKDNWLLLKEKDEYANVTTDISQFNTSVRTGRTMEEIEGGEDEKTIKNPFIHTDVQLPKLVSSVPDNDEWLYELKYDGYRIMSYIEGNSVRLLTRNGNDYLKRFNNIASSLRDLAKGRPMVLDGEMVVTDSSGRTDFNALQNYMRDPKVKNLTYIIFDILALDGQDLREYPLIKRKEILEDLLKDTPKNLFYSRHVMGNGKESFKVACETNMEGIVGKKAESIYSGTKNGDWIKLKCDKRQEFVIGGYTITDKRSISALLLGVYENEELVYAGRAGSGIDQKDRKVLGDKFESLKRIDSPFKFPPEERTNEKIIWLEAELVAEIKFTEFTKDNLLRQASYKGLRTDKNPKDVTKERSLEDRLVESESSKGTDLIEIKSSGVSIEGVRITSPDKIIYEEDSNITKLDVINYYKEVSYLMLPYIENRILSIVRCPKGVVDTCFYKKHPGQSNKNISIIPILNSKEEEKEYFYIEELKGLISEVQMGTLEFHTWGSRVNALDSPDIMVFDLDPDEGMDIDRVRQGVKDLKSILTELSLNSYLKVSGGKGYHVIVPLQPSVTWDAFNDFAKGVAQVMESKWPDRYTSNIRIANRKNKIFIDWIRNGRGATSIAPYSLRARKGAKVSMPISWDELDTVNPDGINMAEALIRITKDDPWEDFFKYNQKLIPYK